MTKIAFLGAGSTVFAKNVLGDCMLTECLHDAHIALFDIDADRLAESELMLKNINANCNNNRATIISYTDARVAFKDADFVVNAIQVGGYEPCTVTDFEIPKKYGLRQTIADTLGIGGIFRGLRTIPVMLEYCAIMEEVCPDAWLLNYTNPMSIITLAILRATKIKTIGLCHSVQVCSSTILDELGMKVEHVTDKIAGINHMAWLLEVKSNGEDLYPEIKRRASELSEKHQDMVRFEIMKRFGYYVTESSEHNAEYLPYFIKDKYPELIEKFNIPLDEYPRRCVNQIEGWKKQRDEIVHNKHLEHERSHEYASYIMEAIITNKPYKIGANVMNTGLITNLPTDCVVEVPCLVDGSGITPCYIGDLPPQLAALNRTNINVHQLTVEAALTLKKEHIYHAAMLDLHTSSELSIDDIYALVDELIEAHEGWLPAYK
ncbi:MAG TPA: alpha-glucosidase/alpha-galactosidase [Firmicutes bacterium]|nr:alpha-glucosidase/alpha-galactosidase [Bacillota bacterium]